MRTPEGLTGFIGIARAKEDMRRRFGNDKVVEVQFFNPGDPADGLSLTEKLKTMVDPGAEPHLYYYQMGTLQVVLAPVSDLAAFRAGSTSATCLPRTKLCGLLWFASAARRRRDPRTVFLRVSGRAALVAPTVLSVRWGRLVRMVRLALAVRWAGAVRTAAPPSRRHRRRPG